MTAEKIIPIAAIIYLISVNIASVIVTCRDKALSKRTGAMRIPEKTLFALSALGGAPAMYLTMKKIRHKTRHKRFMIGIPLIMLCHALIIAAAIYLYMTK